MACRILRYPRTIGTQGWQLPKLSGCKQIPLRLHVSRAMTSSTSNNIFYSSPLHILDYDEEQIGPYAVQPFRRIPAPHTASYSVRNGDGRYEQKAAPRDQAHPRPNSENTIPIPSIYGGGELQHFGLQYGMAAISLRDKPESSQQVEKVTLMRTAPQNLYEEMIRSGDTNLQRVYAASIQSSADRDAGIKSMYVDLRYYPSVYILLTVIFLTFPDEEQASHISAKLNACDRLCKCSSIWNNKTNPPRNTASRSDIRCIRKSP